MLSGASLETASLYDRVASLRGWTALMGFRRSEVRLLSPRLTFVIEMPSGRLTSGAAGSQGPRETFVHLLLDRLPALRIETARDDRPPDLQRRVVEDDPRLPRRILVVALQ